MANFYSHQKEFLGELIRQGSSKQESGATILIPDLQRPYVWTPNQVVLLMDSIIRGWPFGTLLLWKLKDTDLNRFPYRCFYRTVDRTDDNDGERVDMQQPPAEYLMVLDGQQRLQSLLLAVGGDEWGFKLKDIDWAMELHSRKTRQTSYAHWSMASLCFDTKIFLEEYKSKGEKLLAIDFTRVLRWMVIKPVGGQSVFAKPETYEESLECTFKGGNEGRYIRFSRIWQAAIEDAQLKEKDFRNFLKKNLQDWRVASEYQQLLIEPLAELLSTIRDVKMSEVSYLQVNAYSEVWSQNEYNEAIVSIFTRLNTAGRTLTREEITLAWLKTGWQDAGKSFAKLRDDLEGLGLSIGLDELVGLISFIWAIEKRTGKLLQNRDLLDQNIIKPMANDLSESWQKICESITTSMELILARNLKHGNVNQYSSLYTLVIVWVLFYIRETWSDVHPLKSTDKDDFEMKYRSVLDEFLDRWIFGSQWAGRWSIGLVKNVENYAVLLANNLVAIKVMEKADQVLSAIKGVTKILLDDIVTDACSGIDSIQASSRNRVSVYRNFLWVWHRLDNHRWEMTRIALKTGRRKVLNADVDHCIPYKLWERKVLNEWSGTDENERHELADIINELGNCILLEKTFNISKSDTPFSKFVPQIHEFKQGKTVDEWARGLSLSQIVMNGTGSLLELCQEIKSRDAAMRNELKKFIRGEMLRVDV